MSRILKKNILFILVIAFLTGCVEATVDTLPNTQMPLQPRRTSSSTTSPLNTQILHTDTPLPIFTQTAVMPTDIPPTPTITPEPLFSNWDNLEPGEYVAFRSASGGIDVLSLSNLQIIRLTNVFGYPLTPDGHYLNVADDDQTIEVFDLWEAKQISIPVPEGCDCERNHWLIANPTLDYLAASCRVVNEGLALSLIKVINIEDNRCDTLTPLISGDVAYDTPAWSPDGDWIAFLEHNRMWHNIQIYDGLYLMPASCLSTPSECMERTYGPYKTDFYSEGPPFWSKNNRFLLIPSFDEIIYIFDFKVGSIVNGWNFYETDDKNITMLDWLASGEPIATEKIDEGKYDLIRYNIALKQSEVIASELDGSMFFSFVKE